MKRISFLLLALCLFLLPLSSVRAASYDEHQLKAAIIYKVAKFVTWPEETFEQSSSPFIICVMGDEEDFAGFALLEGKLISGQEVQLRKVQTSKEAEGAHLLYVSDTHVGPIIPILTELRDRPILTVSDIEGFSSLGGMITLMKKEANIRLVVNISSSQKANLKISSKLNVLAAEVIRD